MLLSFSGFGQKQYDLEMGASRWNVYNPMIFDLDALKSINTHSESDIFEGDLKPLSVQYHVSQYYLDLTRHVIYGKHKRTEVALGIGLSVSFRDRQIVTSYNEYLRKESISTDPVYVHFKSTDKVWLNLFDRYNSAGLGPKIVARAHFNQRWSGNLTLASEIGMPLNNEFLAMITTVQRSEWTMDDGTSFSERSGIETIMINKPNQWHISLNGRSGFSYKLLENSKLFVELGIIYGARRFFHYPGQTEYYYSPSLGFRAYI